MTKILRLKNMKRFLLFFLLGCKTVFAQMPEGFFSDKTYLPAGEEFSFSAGNHFTYRYNCGDCGSKAGSGVYSVSHDTLELHFQPTCKIEQVHVLDDFFATDFPERDSFFYSVVFAPDTGMQFLTVQVSTNTGTNLRNLKVANGQCNFWISKEERENAYLHITSYTYNEEWVPFKALPGRSKIALTSNKNFRIPPWTVYRFKIVSARKNKLMLIPLKGTMTFSEETGSRIYRRGKLD